MRRIMELMRMLSYEELFTGFKKGIRNGSLHMGATVEILVERPGLRVLAGDGEVNTEVAFS